MDTQIHTRTHSQYKWRLVIPQQDFQMVAAHRLRWSVHVLWQSRPKLYQVIYKLKVMQQLSS